MPPLLFSKRQVLFALIAACIVGVTNSSSALCAPQREEGVWESRIGDSPFQLEIRARNCEVPGGPAFWVTVRVRQSSGALYTRGTFPADWKRTNDRIWWLVPGAYGTGGYREHLWIRYDQGNLLVWVWDESLDAKPSAGTWLWFRHVGR